MTNKVCIELHTDNNYVVPTIVTIASILNNKKSDSIYEIRILTNNVTEKNQRLIQKQLGKYGTVIPHTNTTAKIKSIESQNTTFAKVTLTFTIDGETKTEPFELYFSGTKYKIKPDDKIVIELRKKYGTKNEATYKGHMCANCDNTYHRVLNGRFCYDSKGHPCLKTIAGKVVDLQMFNRQEISSFKKNDDIEIEVDCRLDDEIVNVKHVENRSQGVKFGIFAMEDSEKEDLLHGGGSSKTSSNESKSHKVKNRLNVVNNKVATIEKIGSDNFRCVTVSFENGKKSKNKAKKEQNIYLKNLFKPYTLNPFKPVVLQQGDTIVYTPESNGEAMYKGKLSSPKGQFPQTYTQEYSGRLATINKIYYLQETRINSVPRKDPNYYPFDKKILDKKILEEQGFELGDEVVIEIECNVFDDKIAGWRRVKNLTQQKNIPNNQR